MRYALGIDSGGTKCEAVLAEESGRIVGWGRGGPSHQFYRTPEQVEAAYEQALGEALQGIRGGQFWIGSPSVRPQPWEARITEAGEIREVFCVGEVQAAFACAGEEWGVIVLSGTGSFVHGRTPDGRRLHAGGMGPVLGDHGSGYDIGLRGARAAFASRWIASRRTTLEQAVPRGLGVADLEEVFHLIYTNGIGRHRLASLARIVNEEAERGDPIALRCLTEAADSLADLVVDVVEELGLGKSEFPLIASGSVAQKSRLWWEQVCRRVRETAPRMRPVMTRLVPAAGAALVALRRMGAAPEQHLRSVMEETQERFLPYRERAAAVVPD